MKAAFFGYSWRQDGELDGYMAAQVDGVRRLGVDVDLFIGNEFTVHSGVKGFTQALSSARLATFIRDQSYDFSISFNNALLMRDVVGALSCRPVSVIVDSEHHLFDHAEKGGFSAFDLDVAIASIYTSLQADIARYHPLALSRFYFLPPATGRRRRGLVHPVVRQKISWIASLVGDDHTQALATLIRGSDEDAMAFVKGLRQVTTSGYLDELRADPAVAVLAQNSGLGIELLEVHLQNIVTNDERLRAVELLSSRGLRLYGNARWERMVPYSVAVARSLAHAQAVSSHAEQMEVYDSSLISINIPQVQARGGMQYRVLDVLNSNALLITKLVDDSDISVVFGRENPVVSFRDHQELTKLVDHYLMHEAERMELVKRCQALVAHGFSFTERAADYLRLSNPEAAERLLEGAALGLAPPRPGSLARMAASEFTNWTGLRM